MGHVSAMRIGRDLCGACCCFYGNLAAQLEASWEMRATAIAAIAFWVLGAVMLVFYWFNPHPGLLVGTTLALSGAILNVAYLGVAMRV